MDMPVTSVQGSERSHKRRFLFHVALLTTLNDVASVELIYSLKRGGFSSITCGMVYILSLLFGFSLRKFVDVPLAVLYPVGDQFVSLKGNVANKSGCIPLLVNALSSALWALFRRLGLNGYSRSFQSA